jgi:hypothetical protein
MMKLSYEIRVIRLLPVMVAALFIGACATMYSPEPLDDPKQFASFQSKTIGDVTVSLAILTDEEAKQHFGADLGARGVQALWVSVRNASNFRYWFVRNDVDPDLYSADEAAQLVQKDFSDADFESMRQYFRDESIRVLMEPGHVTEGLIFLPREEGGRYVEIFLASDSYEAELALQDTLEPREKETFGSYNELRFAFALTLPDGIFDYELLDPSAAYEGKELPDLDLDGLRQALGQLPCCVTNADGDSNGDPLNLVLAGSIEEVMFSLSKCRWSFTHRITAGTVGRMIEATLDGEGYAVAPVSSLYVFDRKQDIALQRARRNIAQRFGFVGGSTFAPSDDPAYNLTGDPFYSDGLRLVVMLSRDPVPYTEVRNLLWEESDAPVAEGQSEAANDNVRPISAEGLERK